MSINLSVSSASVLAIGATESVMLAYIIAKAEGATEIKLPIEEVFLDIGFSATKQRTLIRRLALYGTINVYNKGSPPCRHIELVPEE